MLLLPADPINFGATGEIKILRVKLKIVSRVLYLGKNVELLIKVSFTPLQYISEETAVLSQSVYSID